MFEMINGLLAWGQGVAPQVADIAATKVQADLYTSILFACVFGAAAVGALVIGVSCFRYTGEDLSGVGCFFVVVMLLLLAVALKEVSDIIHYNTAPAYYTAKVMKDFLTVP